MANMCIADSTKVGNRHTLDRWCVEKQEANRCEACPGEIFELLQRRLRRTPLPGDNLRETPPQRGSAQPGALTCPAQQLASDFDAIHVLIILA